MRLDVKRSDRHLWQHWCPSKNQWVLDVVEPRRGCRNLVTRRIRGRHCCWQEKWRFPVSEGRQSLIHVGLGIGLSLRRSIVSRNKTDGSRKGETATKMATVFQASAHTVRGLGFVFYCNATGSRERRFSRLSRKWWSLSSLLPCLIWFTTSNLLPHPQFCSIGKHSDWVTFFSWCACRRGSKVIRKAETRG